MKSLFAPVFIINVCALFLVGCFNAANNTDNPQTDLHQVSIGGQNIETVLLEPGNISALIETNLITVSWNSVVSATDYKVYRSSDSESYSEGTDGITHYSFATNTEETYKIWVTSISAGGQESDSSRVLEVISKTQGVEAVCSECAP